MRLPLVGEEITNEEDGRPVAAFATRDAGACARASRADRALAGTRR